MSNISFHLIRGDKVDSVVAFQPESDTPLHQADSNHPYWDQILNGLYENDPKVFDLFDVASATANKLMVLSERVTYDYGIIRFDGEEQEGPLAEHLIRVIKSDSDDYGPVVRFWENVAANPSEHSRKALFDWLARHEFSIDEDGYIVGYKSVVTKTDKDGNPGYTSTRKGDLFVDGVAYTANDDIPVYRAGSVLTMPRKDVNENHNIACSTGIHVGDFSYAQNFSGDSTVEVRVNPRDVVSIPNDDTRKMRACRVEIVGKVDAPVEGPVKLNLSEKPVEASVGYRPFG